MIFPFETEGGQEPQERPIPKEYEIDYESGQLTGRVVLGLEAIKVWVWLALQTARYRYYIYSWDYGQEFEGLMGKAYSEAFLECEAESLVTECLLVNPFIKEIQDFAGTFQEDVLTASFRLVTDYGEVITDVRGNDLRFYHGTDDGRNAGRD